MWTVREVGSIRFCIRGQKYGTLAEETTANALFVAPLPTRAAGGRVRGRLAAGSPDPLKHRLTQRMDTPES